MITELLREYVYAVITERKLRETDAVELASGGSVRYGSDKYLHDLKRRIKELELWRSHQDRGSDARANYTRLLSRLRGELKSLEMKREKKLERAREQDTSNKE